MCTPRRIRLPVWLSHSQSGNLHSPFPSFRTAVLLKKNQAFVEEQEVVEEEAIVVCGAGTAVGGVVSGVREVGTLETGMLGSPY